jgi:hypothetical protein
MYMTDRETKKTGSVGGHDAVLRIQVGAPPGSQRGIAAVFLGGLTLVVVVVILRS